ncbi:MAG: DUF4150 domain-containing protein [Bryobacterales bacterium]|nr:DUF4150 domain-containing protein [Bryobacterales bacterium]
MPGPPAPFVPSPLPNIAKSELSPKGYSTSVKIEGNTVAIRGATFESIGDIASKGTGGGLISANTHGPAKFITPGSLTVKIEGKSVHLLGEPMLNNCAAGGTPPNTGATLQGVKQQASEKTVLRMLKAIVCECNRQVQQAPPGKKQKTCAQLGEEKHACCEEAIKKKGHSQIEGEKGYGTKPDYKPITGMTRTQARAAGLGKGTSWPDCTITDANGNKQLVDFKFKCPPNTPVRKKKKGGNLWIKTPASSPGKWPTWTQYKNGSNQEEKYKELGKAQKPPITTPPRIVDNKGCRK